MNSCFLCVLGGASVPIAGRHASAGFGTCRDCNVHACQLHGDKMGLSFFRCADCLANMKVISVITRTPPTNGRSPIETALHELLSRPEGPWYEALAPSVTAHIARLTNDLTQTAASLAKTETTLQATEAEVKKRDAKIAELESTNQQLDKQAADLSASITNLNNKITETQRKLTAAEGDKAFLQKELERLIAEKTELEKQFNDLAVLRQQVKHLKEELSIARRIEWIRQGLFGAGETKGAQQLVQNLGAPLSKTKTNYDLNVEINADGSVKVIVPLQNTNAPQFQPVPPK